MELSVASERFIDSFNRVKTKRRGVQFKELTDVTEQIRSRRKLFLGSHLSLKELVCEKEIIREDAVIALSEYLAVRTMPFLRDVYAESKEFCFRYYQLAIYMIAGENLGKESVDDIILLADCLVRSRDVFIEVGKRLLPKDMLGELFAFSESYSDVLYTPYFTDAVLGAVSVFLGVLPDLSEGKTGEEA